MSLYAESSKASQESGKILRTQFVNLKPPVTAQDWESLIKASIKFCNDFRGVLSSVMMFGKECNSLISGDVEGFMQKVETRKPEVYDLIRFFGRNYDPKTDSLDLTNLPMLFRIYSLKIKKKDSKVLSKEVKEGGKVVSRTLQMAKLIGRQSRTKNKYLTREFLHSQRRLFEEQAKLRSKPNVAIELSRNAPPWVGELIMILEDVGNALPGLSRPGFR